MAMTQVVQDILNIITYHYGIILDDQSVSYSRAITHLQCFAQRMLHQEHIQSEDDYLAP